MKIVKGILYIIGILIAISILGALIGLIFPEPTYEQTTPVDVTPTAMSAQLPIDRTIAKYDWDGGRTTNTIGYFSAPAGCKYIIIEYTIQNDGWDVVYSNPLFWNYYSNGIKYSYNDVSHSDEINTQDVEIGHGGKHTNTIVYIVPNSVTTGSFEYDPWYGVKYIYRIEGMFYE